MLTTVTGVKFTPPFSTNAPVDNTDGDIFVTDVTANLIPGAKFVSGYPVTVTVLPELDAVAANENVPVVPDPPKLLDNVNVVPDTEDIVVPSGNVSVPRVIATVIPGSIPFIDPVITTVGLPTVTVVPVIPVIGAGIIQLFVTSCIWVIS
jgi:hypothetical protein